MREKRGENEGSGRTYKTNNAENKTNMLVGPHVQNSSYYWKDSYLKSKHKQAFTKSTYFETYVIHKTGYGMLL